MTAIAGQPDAAPVDLRVLIGYPLDAPMRIEQDGEGVDLTDATGTAQIRRTRASTSVLLECTVDIVLPQTGDDKGRYRLTAEEDDTADLYPVVGVYDVRFDGLDEPHRWVGGNALIEQPVSQVSGS